MKVEYNGHANDNGIYRIRNTTNDRVYYGSCLRFKSRFKSHSNTLASGKHGNRFLQADYNKCQPSDFVFEVVEVVNVNLYLGMFSFKINKKNMKNISLKKKSNN